MIRDALYAAYLKMTFFEDTGIVAVAKRLLANHQVAVADDLDRIKIPGARGESSALRRIPSAANGNVCQRSACSVGAAAEIRHRIRHARDKQ